MPDHIDDSSTLDGAAGSALAWAFHRLAVATGELDAALARRMHLGASDYLALKHLMVASEPLGPVELGRLLGMSSGAATGLVDRLQSGGHVQRQPHPRDRRRQVVTATPQTEQRLLRELEPVAAYVDQAAADLTADQQHLLADLLTRVSLLHRRHAHR